MARSRSASSTPRPRDRAAVAADRRPRRAAPPTATASPPAAPRFATAWAALVYALSTLALGFPAFAGKFLVNQNSDQYIAGYAFREYAAASLRAGRGFPEWNPYLFGGVPFVAGMGGDIFYPPTVLLRMVVPTDVAMTWGFILHVFLAGLFTHLFLRALGLGFAGALVGGLAYMLGGNVAGLVSPGHDGKLYVATLLPLVLLFVLRGVRDGRPWAWGGLALAVMLAALAPHPQLFQYLLLVAGAWALWTAFACRGEDAPLARPVALRRLALAACAVAIGMLGSAVQFWPVLEYAPWSPRAGGAGWEHAISYSLPPEELLNTYLPQFSGILELYSGRNAMHLHSEYLGAAILVLAGLAFGGARSRRSLLWFWTGALVVSTLWALGGFTPFYHLVYAVVPGTKFFRAPSTMLYVVSFCAAVLAALGVERALATPPRPRYAVAWLVAATLVAVLATFGTLSSFASSFAPTEYHLQRAYANAGPLMIGGWRSWLAVLAAGGVLVALARGALSPRAAGWALAAVVALDLWSVERLYWRFLPPASQLYASDAVIDYLRKLPQPGRVLAFAAAPTTGTIRDPYLGGEGKATGFMVHGVRNVVGYHGNELGRYDVLTQWDTEDYLARMSNPNVRRLLNVRFLYTNTATAPIKDARLVAGPARNAAGDTVYLYQLAEDNPDAWVAPLAVKAPDESVLATLLDPRFDVRRAALFDTAAAAVPSAPVPPALPEPSDVGAHVTHFAPGRITVALDRPAPANASLVVSENYYPGWSATVDGKPGVVARADYVLMGVPLPAGARTVELTFHSARYHTGKTVTLVAAALALVWLVLGVVQERRTATAAA